MILNKLRFVVLMLLFLLHRAKAQNYTSQTKVADSSQNRSTLSHNKIYPADLRELCRPVLHLKNRKDPELIFPDSTIIVQPLSYPAIADEPHAPKNRKLLFSPFPAVGYALQTGMTAVVAMNLSFYSSTGDGTNISSIQIYPQLSLNYPQFLCPMQFNLWTRKNKYNIIGDWRFYKYPTYTFGLGSHSQLSDADKVNYSYLKFYQTVLKQIAGSKFYGGIGYDLDYHYNIHDLGNGEDFQNYTDDEPSTTSSGLVGTFIYDSRRNSNFPENATYANFTYRNNSPYLGSNNSWQSVFLEFKKYINVLPKSHNVLAIWWFNWYTFGGKAPYFDLPSTGWDTYSNSGRGYIQSRYRGPGMLYLETEYRFRILKSGLLGGVIFANAQSVSEWETKKFEKVMPGAGTGIRLKINKLSGVNLAIDYAWGIGGSRGLFFNVSEVY